MMVVHDEGTRNDDAASSEKASSSSAASSSAYSEQQHALIGKERTYEVCMQIKALLDSSSGTGSVHIDCATLQGWFDHLKDANKSISRYVKAVVGERRRSDTETHLLKYAMLNDILDREATFTETLEAFVDAGGHDRVGKAMRFVANVNGSISNLAAAETCTEVSGAAECVAILDAGGKP
jgi:hypothetical protein